MAKFEYRVCAVPSDSPGEVEHKLNAILRGLGEDGWRFVETIYAQNSLPLLLFKKQAKPGVKFPKDKQTLP